MDGIEIKGSLNRECYAKMIQLKNRWDMAECIPPTSSNARGDVYREMENIGNAYVALKQAMSELLDCTAKFIINTDVTFEEADILTAGKIAE